MIRFANLSTDPRYFRWNFVASPFDFTNWVKEENWAWDADNCGDTTMFFVVVSDDGLVFYYEVKHSWWIEYNPDWEIHNEFEITLINPALITGESKKNLRFVV